jgi:hypothetical protein
LCPKVDGEDAFLERGECGAGEGHEADFGVDKGLKKLGTEKSRVEEEVVWGEVVEDGRYEAGDGVDGGHVDDEKG